MPLPTASSQLNNPSHSLLHNEGANVKSFGAVGDGVADDTASIQACIDACISAGAVSTTRSGLRDLFFPVGIYKVTAPLVVRSVRGFRMSGSGMETYIQASGTFSPIVDLNGLAHCKIEGFTIRGTASGTNTDALLLRWSAGTGRSTTMNIIEDVFIEGGNWVNGIHVGDTDTQVDETLITGCKVSGQSASDATYWQHGYLLGNGTTGNVLTQTLLKPNVNVCKNGIGFNGSAATVLGGGMQNNGNDLDEMVACADAPIVVKGLRSEGSDRLWTSTVGAGGYANLASVEDTYWAGTGINADGRFIEIKKGGFHRFKNILVVSSGAVSPTVRLDNGSLGPGHVTLENVSTKTAGASLVSVGSTTQTYDVIGYYQNNDGFLFTGGIYSKRTGAQDAPVLATASLPAAATAMDGRILIEDNGAGDRNLIIYAGGQRFRIDGGANF